MSPADLDHACSPILPFVRNKMIRQPMTIHFVHHPSDDSTCHLHGKRMCEALAGPILEYDSAAMGCRGQFILPLKYAYQIYQLFSEQLWNDIVSQSDIIFVMNVCPLKISAVLNQCCGISKRCGLCELT